MNELSTCIMMVTFNRLNLTIQTLESLFKNTKNPFKLVIVDNGSADGTKNWIEDNKSNLLQNSSCLQIETLFNETNLGIAVGRNQCLKIANTLNCDYLSTIDNDVLFHENWLNECLEFLAKNENFAIGISFEPNQYPIHNLNGFNVQVKPAGNLGTACTVFHRKLHTTIGYFTTDFGLYGEEDADFFFRARQVGYKMAYLKNKGIHLGEGDYDVGEYREFKTKCHKENYDKFIKTCHEYVRGKKSIYISF